MLLKMALAGRRETDVKDVDRKTICTRRRRSAGKAERDSTLSGFVDGLWADPVNRGESLQVATGLLQ